MSELKRVRCAIYTRKSTEEGLDQTFNSLDAQREACEAFVASQKHEGWKTLKQHYDDGGISGGHMDRPALKRLLADIRAGKVDRVIVYKIDRLTRSLADFARLVDLFDQNACSFVSVTQAFNTSTSMGRLTLNVLLSFAQFEREVTAERIRDKIAASKKKGMWMGGLVPLGYDVERFEGGRKLVINQKEATTVRRLFDLMIEEGNLGAAAIKAHAEGLHSKRRLCKDGSRIRGGRPLSRGQLHYLLRNPIYLGRIRHLEQTHDGLHEAIIPEDIFDAVGRILDANRQGAGRQANQKHSIRFPLAGKLLDEEGNPLSTSWSTARGRVHRYYTTPSTARSSVQRYNAQALETVVEAALVKRLQELETRFAHCLQLADDRPSGEATPGAKPNDDPRLIANIQVSDGQFVLDIDPGAITAQTGFVVSGEALRVELPRLQKRLHGQRLMIGSLKAQPNPNLKLALHKAGKWRQALCRGVPISQIAASESVTDGIIRSRVQLAHLAPDIQRAILRDQAPQDLTLEKLVRADIPCCWHEQRSQFGFTQSA